jgi:hypothetical protein
MCKTLDDDFKNRVALEGLIKDRKDLKTNIQEARQQCRDLEFQREELTFEINRLQYEIPAERLKIIKRLAKSDPKTAEKMAEELEQELTRRRQIEDKEIKQLTTDKKVPFRNDWKEMLLTGKEVYVEYKGDGEDGLDGQSGFLKSYNEDLQSFTLQWGDLDDDFSSFKFDDIVDINLIIEPSK